MREILFRGQSEETKEWVYGDLIYEPYGTYIQYLEDNKRIKVKIIPETVGQYIGFKTEDEYKLFEGDIVCCIFDGEIFNYVITFDEDELDFKATNGEKNYGNHFMYLKSCDSVTRIGNIYENKDMLDR